MLADWWRFLVLPSCTSLQKAKRRIVTSIQIGSKKKLALSIVLLKRKVYGTQNWLVCSHFDSFRFEHSFPCETKEGKSKFKFLIPYHLLSGTCFDFCLFQPLAFNIFFVFKAARWRFLLQ